MLRAIFRVLLLCLFVTTLAAAAALAQDNRADGVAAFQRGDYPTARKLLQPLADDPLAAFALGRMAMDGLGGPVDYQAAGRYFAVGAAAGHVGAIASLGFLHDNGWGVSRDGWRAQALYRAAARAGNTMSMNNLAYLWGRQGELLQQALCLSARTLEIEPRNPHYLDTYGFILLQLGRPAEADRYFRRALDHRPDLADGWEHRGDVAAMTGGDGSAYWRQALGFPRDERQGQRIEKKLRGAPANIDLNAHPPFELRGEGFPPDCAVPSV